MQKLYSQMNYFFFLVIYQNQLEDAVTNDDSATQTSNSYLIFEHRPTSSQPFNDQSRQISLCTARDLISWSFQIARGMQYLAQRKVCSMTTFQLLIY